MKRFNPSEIEPKWQKIWADDKRYNAPDSSDKPKYYIASMFPYPSGAGMHVGHFMEHSIVDAVARFRRANGDNVMYPMGFDNFGLPAENYAIKTGVSPQESTSSNIANFKTQLERVGASIDWSREIWTSDPEYYRWTQWIFTKLFERGLAYQKESMQWWCPVDKTVLANEQVEAGRCWRCGTEVVKKSMKQWFFEITEYADALLDEIPALDWPDKIKLAQENWIGKSEGAEITFQVEDEDAKITVFSTRPDTIFGASFLVIAPEHPLARRLATNEMRQAVDEYSDGAIKKSEIERQSEGKEKTGVWTGSYAINPASGEKMPIWIADYVLGGYGTGAVMGVPAHDERDYEFASKFNLPIVQVIASRHIDETSPFEPGKEVVSRQVVTCVIKHPTEDLYLIGLPKGGRKWAPLMGGIEDGESIVETARREIIEETGYSDIKSVEQKGQVFAAEFFAAHKDLNRIAYANIVYVELNSLKQDMTQAVDKDEQDVKWVTKDEFVASDSSAPTNQHVFDEAHVDRGELAREGRMINSGQFDGRESSEVREEIVAWLKNEGKGSGKTIYKMRDWLISRQRYWGAPIPIIHCPEHGAVAVPDDQLPVVLPVVEDFAPKGDGKSPLSRQAEWVETTCPECGSPAKRETDVMDGYACSSWYLLRYTDPHDAEQAWAPALAGYWTPVDMYVGGDHAVAHLLYVRFWSHVFYDMQLVPTKEPVKRLVYHGYINAEDGTKMSKSKGNVVDPLEVINAGYGADALRTFELFLGPINENSNWSSRGIAGVYRFLNRFWTLVQEFDESDKQGNSDIKLLENITHQTIKKVSHDIHRLSFNTAIAALMECVNELYKLKVEGYTHEWQENLEKLTQIIQPFAPHMAAELWRQLGHESQLDFEPWPLWDEQKIAVDTMTIIVQVNGKLRAKLEVAKELDEAAVKEQALAAENVVKFLDNKKPTKVIYIPGRLVNIVIS